MESDRIRQKRGALIKNESEIIKNRSALAPDSLQHQKQPKLPKASAPDTFLTTSGRSPSYPIGPDTLTQRFYHFWHRTAPTTFLRISDDPRSIPHSFPLDPADIPMLPPPVARHRTGPLCIMPTSPIRPKTDPIQSHTAALFQIISPLIPAAAALLPVPTWALFSF